MGQYVINRPEGGEVFLSPFNELDTKGAEIGGTFVGSLEKLNG